MSFPGWSIGKPQIGGNPFDRIMPPPVPGAPAPAAPAAPAVPAGAPPAVPGGPLPVPGPQDFSAPPTPPDPNQFAPPQPPGRESVYEGPSGEMAPQPDMPDSGNLMYWQQLANTPIGTATQADPYGPMFRNLQRNVAAFMAQRDAKKMQEAQARFDSWEAHRNQKISGEVGRVLEAGGTFADLANIDRDFGPSEITGQAREILTAQIEDEMEVWTKLTDFRQAVYEEKSSDYRAEIRAHQDREDRRLEAAQGVVQAVVAGAAIRGNPAAIRIASTYDEKFAALLGGGAGGGSGAYQEELGGAAGGIAGLGFELTQPTMAAIQTGMANGDISFMAEIGGGSYGSPHRGMPYAFVRRGGSLSESEATSVEDLFGSKAVGGAMMLAGGSLTADSVQQVGSAANGLTREESEATAAAINIMFEIAGSDQRISGAGIRGPEVPAGGGAAGASGARAAGGAGSQIRGDRDYWVNVAGFHPDWLDDMEAGRLSPHVLNQKFLEAQKTGTPAFYMQPKENSRQTGPPPSGPRPIQEIIAGISKTPEEILKIRERVETLGLTEKQIKARYDELAGKGALDRQEQGELTELHIWLKEAGIIE